MKSEESTNAEVRMSALLLVALSFLGGCDVFYTYDQTVLVKVTDAESDSPVPSASVTIAHDYEVRTYSGDALDQYLDSLEQFSDTTDSNGQAVPVVQNLGSCGGIYLWIGPCPQSPLPDQVTGWDLVVRVQDAEKEEVLEMVGGQDATAVGDRFTVTIVEVGAPQTPAW